MQVHELIGGGLGVALTTPFDTNGAINETALARLVQHVVAGGADFVVALGSTGEASMLDERERARVLAIVDEHRGAAKLVVGTGASSTAEACRLTIAAAAAGADGALVTAPPYTKPTQKGIVAHFQAIQRAAPAMPLIAYNVPSRTGVNIEVATALELLGLQNVLALKESSGDLQQIARIAAAAPDDRAVLAGDDVHTLATIAVGGFGVVSVAGNAVPDRMRELCTAALAGDLHAAREHHKSLLPLFDALCREPNPIPIKAAVAMLGIGGAAPRLPLLEASEGTRKELQRTMFQLPATRQRDAIHHA